MVRIVSVWNEVFVDITEGFTEEKNAWHLAMKQKYEYDACHPRLPIPPDPPEPN